MIGTVNGMKPGASPAFAALILAEKLRYSALPARISR